MKVCSQEQLQCICQIVFLQAQASTKVHDWIATVPGVATPGKYC